MATRRIQGTDIYTEDTGGPGIPVVFLHGFLFDGRMYDDVVLRLGDGYRVIRPDFPGQGRSGPSSVGYASDRLTDLVIAWLDELALGPVHLAGLSMGGFTAMRIAARRPDLVETLTLLNTSANAHPRSKFPKQLVLAAIARVAGTGIPPVTSGIEKEMYGTAFRRDPAAAPMRATWRTRWAASDRAALVSTLLGFMLRPDFRDELGTITAPTLVIAGGADASLSPHLSQEMHERIDRSRLIVLDGVGHSSPLEDPDGVARALVDFWAEVPDPA